MKRLVAARARAAAAKLRADTEARIAGDRQALERLLG